MNHDPFIPNAHSLISELAGHVNAHPLAPVKEQAKIFKVVTFGEQRLKVHRDQPETIRPFTRKQKSGTKEKVNECLSGMLSARARFCWS